MKACLDDPASLSDKKREELGIRLRFPSNVGEALDNLKADTELAGILGRPVVDTYLTVKKAEHEMLEEMDPEMRRHWLIERY